MIKKFKLISAALLFVGVFAITAPPAVEAQVTPTDIFTLTNLPTTCAASSGVVMTNIINLTKNCALSFNPSFSVVSGTAAGNYFIYPSTDGTNFATTNAWVVSINANGTTPVRGYTNWTSLQLAGFVALDVYAFSNANASTLTFTPGNVFNRVRY